MIRYPIFNKQFCSTAFIDNDTLVFERPRKRFPKKRRKQVNSAVALLKGDGFLKPKSGFRESYESISIDKGDLENWITRNHYELIRRFGIKDTVIIMGQSDFHSLSGQLVNRHMMIPLTDFNTYGNISQNRFKGMYLVVIPWMDGTVLIPKEYMPIDREFIPSGVLVSAENQAKLERDREGMLAGKLWNDFMGRDDL